MNERIVTLTPFERRLVAYVAKNRQVNADAGHKGNAVRADQKRSDWQITVDGLEAEYAFCKLANVWPDLSEKVPLTQVDAVLPNGITVDVKGTEYSYGKLLAPDGKERLQKQADVFVLMTNVDYDPISETVLPKTPTQFRYVGWAEHDVVISDAALAEGRDMPRPCYAVKQKDLHKTLIWTIDTLPGACEY